MPEPGQDGEQDIPTDEEDSKKVPELCESCEEEPVR
jgi:hypothetical protein